MNLIMDELYGAGARDGVTTIPVVDSSFHIPFNASEGSSLGVEFELEIVDRGTRELVSAASDLLDDLGGQDQPKVKHELFECTLE
ncbi:MAG: hypothetical protein M3159_09895, partial [Actinomycetota bacterium]|nr:hypothetical protein [Actinomycetota bacterium]